MTLRRGLFAKYRLKAMGRVAVLRLDHGCAPEDVEDVVQAMLEALESEVSPSRVPYDVADS